MYCQASGPNCHWDDACSIWTNFKFQPKGLNGHCQCTSAHRCKAGRQDTVRTTNGRTMSVYRHFFNLNRSAKGSRRLSEANLANSVPVRLVTQALQAGTSSHSHVPSSRHNASAPLQEQL